MVNGGRKASAKIQRICEPTTLHILSLWGIIYHQNELNKITVIS